MATHDLIIRNGLVYDGTGDAPVETDIAIDNGVISMLGKILREGA